MRGEYTELPRGRRPDVHGRTNRALRPRARPGYHAAMDHLVIFLSVVTIAAGASELSLAAAANRAHRRPALRDACGLVGTLLLISAVKNAYAYALVNIGITLGVDIAAALSPMAWLPPLMYFSGMLLADLSGKVPRKAVLRAVLVLSALVWGSCILAILASGTPSAAFTTLRLVNRNLLTPLACLALFVPAFLYVVLGDPKDSARAHPFAYGLLAVTVTAVLGYAALKALSLAYPEAGNRLFRVVPNFYIMFFVGSSFIFMKRGGFLNGASAARASALELGRRALPANAVEADWAMISGRVEREKAYRDPNLDLSSLSASVGIPRNRISAAIGAMAGSNFLAYLNERRVREFLDIAGSPDYSGDILSAAFEAGFNSKATFYSWFRKLTGRNPTEYLESLRARSSALGDSPAEPAAPGRGR